MLKLKERLRGLFDGHPLRLIFLLTTALLPFVAVVAWLIADYWAVQRASELLVNHERQLDLRSDAAVKDFDSAFKILRGLPDYLADDSVIVSAVESRDPRQLLIVNQFLARYSASFEVDAVFVLDAAGACLAASNYLLPESFVGHNYADRRYFTEALFAKHGSQFAVGRVTNVPGFFFSSPIFKGDERVGVIVVKVNAPELERRIRLQNTFITDEQGVVVMAENPRQILRLVPDAPLTQQSAAYREGRYKRINFEWVDLQAMSGPGRLYLLGGERVAVRKQALMDGAYFLYVYEPVTELQGLPEEKRSFLIGLLLGGAALAWALVATAVFFLRAKLYQQRIEQSNEALSRLNRVLHKQATHDQLTGCLNRRALNEALEREMVRARRYALPLCVGMLDIDFFKKVNDTRGHSVGDLALRHLAEQVTMRIRQCDIFARYGGEEFVLLMPGTSVVNATSLLDRIRQELATVPVPEVEPPLFLTFSAGVAPHAAALTVAELMGRADAALYLAKQSGRNQVVVGGETLPESAGNAGLGCQSGTG